MVDDELDLEAGSAVAANRASSRRQRRKSSESGSSSSASNARAEQKQDVEVTSRLDRVLDRIAKNREAAGDDELADVLREDREQMAQGVVSVTSSVTGLRMPVIMVLNVVEPVLAFGRVVRILLGRFQLRRYNAQMEREQAMAEQQAAENGGASAGVPSG